MQGYIERVGMLPIGKTGVTRRHGVTRASAVLKKARKNNVAGAAGACPSYRRLAFLAVSASAHHKVRKTLNVDMGRKRPLRPPEVAG
jgi:hypothetical protein